MLERNSFYQTLASRRFSSDTKTGMGVLLILEYMIYRLDINTETKLTFDLLRENVSRTIPDDDFISAVFYLTRKEQNVGALRQIIEAHDPKHKQRLKSALKCFLQVSRVVTIFTRLR